MHRRQRLLQKKQLAVRVGRVKADLAAVALGEFFFVLLHPSLAFDVPDKGLGRLRLPQPLRPPPARPQPRLSG